MTGDKLTDYPCGEWYLTNCFHPLPPCDKADECEQLAANRELIALRRAILGDMTPEEAARLYLRAALMIGTVECVDAMAHFNALANVAADAPLFNHTGG